jgi:hypothetical protein
MTEYADLLREREDLKKKLENPEAEAEAIFDLIFRKEFKTSGDWIEQNKRIGRRNSMLVSFLGGVRHLWPYLHPEKRVQSAMDRRGTNSIIQGPASNLGFIGAYFTRKLVWELFESRGVMLGYKQCNAVHDSIYSECVPVNIPLVDYLRQHGCTTMLHCWMRDSVGFQTIIPFEMDCAIGATQAEMITAVRWDDQVEAIQKGLEWKRENLGLKQPINAIMEIVQHNAEIMFGIRQREIKEQLQRNERVCYTMYLNKDNALKQGLRFKMPKVMEAAKRRQDSWKDELE